MFSKKIVENLNKSSWIREMFEQGEKLRAIYGKENVFDFSLGNPNNPIPNSVRNSLKQLVNEENNELHKYMNNAGYPDIREKIADVISKEANMKISGKNIIMTCGAAGALNTIFKTLLNPNEEVIVFAPYFVEYLFYIDNHGGKAVIAKTDDNTFEPNIESLEKSITEKTKAIIINSPNNPTGVIYSEEILNKISELINKKQEEYKTTIFVISDEPYNKIVYDDAKCPNMFNIFENSILANSFSKTLNIPGERMGYIAVNPAIKEVETLINGLAFSNRTLGFVNAPSLFQKAIINSIEDKVDVSGYKEKRDILYKHLIKLGFSCVEPKGAFYLFPKSPITDDVEFVKIAMKYNILLVPGSGFGYPGYFRISYCADKAMIEKSLNAFSKLAQEVIK